MADSLDFTMYPNCNPTVISDFAKDLEPQSILSLTKHKINFILGLSTKQTPLTSLATEFSLIPPPPGTPLVSYFPKRDEPASVIPITPSPLDKNNKILSKDLAPVWFSGAPHALGNNPLLVPILHAPKESFGSDIDGGTADAVVDAADKGGEGLWAGSQLGVVTGFQTLDNARVTWLGGVDVFTDEYMQKEVSKSVLSSANFLANVRGVKSGNAQFARDIVAWTFQENLVLRIDKVEHHKVNATEPSEQYTVNDQLVNFWFHHSVHSLILTSVRFTIYISQSSIQKKENGGHVPVLRISNSNLQCWTLTSVRLFNLSQVNPEDIRPRSGHLTDTVFSNLSLITNGKGMFLE